MAPGLTEQILLQIQAAVSGQQQITGLTNSLSSLSAATQQVNGRFLDSAGRLREANGQFVALGGAARTAQGGLLGAASGAQGLNLGLLNLNAGMQIVQQVSAAVQGLVGQMKEWADASNKATTDTRVFELTLGRFGVRVDEANGAAERLAVKFGLSVEEVKGAMTNLIRVGFRDMGQLEQLMTGAAASSIAFGRTAAEGFDRIGDAATTGLSAALNSIGIAENLGPAYDQAAKSLGKTADELNEAEKATVLYNLVTKATRTEVEALGEIQNDYVRSQQQADLAQKSFAKAMGELTIPVMIQLNRAGAETVGTVVDIIKAYRGGGDAAAKFAKDHPQVWQAIQRVAPALREMSVGITDAWDGIKTATQSTLIPILQSVQPIVERVWRYVPGVVSSAASAVGEAFRLIDTLWQQVLRPVWEAIAPVVESTFKGVLRILGGAFDLIKGIFQAVRALIDGDWQGAWRIASQAVGSAFDRIWEVVKDLAPRLWAAIQKIAVDVWDRAKYLGNQLRDGMIEGLSGLAVTLATRIDEAMDHMTRGIPTWAKNLLGITAGDNWRQGIIDSLTQAGAAADARGADRAAGATASGIAADAGQLAPGSLALAAWQQAFQARGDKFADGVVDYCARWVRDTLGDARPAARAQIDKLFQQTANGATPTAVSAAANFKAKGLMRDYSSTADLKPGDTVFYTDGGQNHVGIYIGAGQVRGNNRVTYGQNGGKFDAKGNPISTGVNPVGNVNINSLGSVSGFVRASELEAYLKAGGQPGSAPAPAPAPKPGPAPAPTPTTPSTDGPITSAQIAKAQTLLAALDKAKKALEADPKNVGLIKAFDEADRSVKSWTKGNDSNARALAAVQAGLAGVKKASDTYVATQAELKKYGTEALLLVKEQEAAAKSGSSAEVERVRGKVTAFTEAGKAQAAVFAAEGAAYQARKQAAEKDKNDAKERQQQEQQAANQLRALTTQQLQQRVQAEQQTGRALDAERERRVAAASGDLVRQRELEQEYQERSLAQARVTAQVQLVLVKRSAEDAYTQAVAAIPKGASDAQRKAIEDGAKVVRTGAVSAAYREYYDAVGAAAEQGAQRVQAAQQAITESVTNLGGIDARGAVPEQISLQTIVASLPRSRAEVAGFEKALRELNAEGKISARVLETALLLIPDFGVALGQVGEAFAATEAQLEAQAKRLDDLNDQYERGETTQDAYRDSLVDLAAGYTRQAQAAERAGKSDIAVFFRNAATEAMKLAEGVGYVSDALRQLQEQIDQNSNDAAAFAGVDALFQGDAATVATRLADEIANGVPEQLNGPARDRFAAGLTRWLGSVDLATAGRTVLNGLLTKLDGKDSSFAQQLARAVTQAAEGLTSADLDGAVSAIVQNLSSAEAALGPDGLMGADVAGVSAYVDTLRGAIPLLERVAALAKGTNLEAVVQGALDGTRAQLETASTRLTELFTRFGQDFSADALEQLLSGITDAVDKVTEKFGQNQITAEEYNGTLLAQADALAALLTRLRAMGPEYAAAADSVSLLLGSTLGLTQGLKDLDVPLSAGEAQLADMVVSLLPLEKGLRDGTMTLGEFTAAALEAIPKIEALARAAMLAGDPELAGQYRQLANELRGMGGPTLKVAEGLGKFQQYAGYAQQLAGSFGQLAGAFGNDDLAANLQGIANFAGKAISLAGDVMRILANPADIGAWVSAITTVVSSIAEAINGNKKAYAEAKKAREEYQKGFSIINTDAFASFSVRSRGWLADTFGGGPEVMRVVNEFAANIARTIEQGVKNGFSNGIKNFLNGTGDLLSGIREGVRGAIIDAVTQALIEGAILKGQLGGLLTSLTTALAGGQDPSGIIAAIAQALPGVAASLTQVLTPIRSAIDQAFPRDMGSSTGGSFSGGSGATFQAGTPQVVIDVLGETRTLLKGANEVMTVMADAARLQYRAGELMYAAAERMYGPHGTSTAGAR